MCVHSREMCGCVWREHVCMYGGEMMYVCRMCVHVCGGERESVCVWWGNVCVCRMCVGLYGGEMYRCVCVCVCTAEK